MKDIEDRIFTGEEGIKGRWKKYFDELQNEKNEMEEIDGSVSGPVKEISVTYGIEKMVQVA